MKSKKIYIILSVVFIFSIISSLMPCIGYGQTYRDNLIIPSHKIFENILKYQRRKDYEKIGKLIDMTSNLIANLDKKYKMNIESRLKKSLKDKNDDEIIRFTYKLIILDMKDLFGNGIDFMKVSSEYKEKANAKFKTAYLDYLVLSPIMEKKDFNSDLIIKNKFRKAVTTNIKHDEAGKIIKEIEDKINNILLKD
ncbi:MAG: hypothetical protein ACE5EA_06210 [Nitrospirota bacterium]